MRIPAILFAIALSAAVPGFAQRHVSPLEHTAIDIAGQHIVVDYYAPSMYGRKIMGGLVPFNTVWCTGANYATQIVHSSAALQFGNLRLSKGQQSIWTLPNPSEWTLIINNQTGQFHLSYDASTDLGRTKMNLKTLASPVETFKIELRPDGASKGVLALIWERTEASIPFNVLP